MLMYMKLASKVLHKIHIENNVYFMQDFDDNFICKQDARCRYVHESTQSWLCMYMY